MGEGAGYRFSFSDIISPPPSLSSEYCFSFFLLDAGIKVVAKPMSLSFQDAFYRPSMPEVIFSPPEYWKCSLGCN